MTERAIEPINETDVNERIVAIIREHLEPLFPVECFFTVMAREKDSVEGDALSIVTDDPDMDGVFGIETAPDGATLH